MMRIAVVHHSVVDTDGPDEQDVLVQVEVVRKALEGLGHRVITLGCTLNFNHIRRQIEAFSPELVFNLVESLEGQGRFIHLFPYLLDSLVIPYTGASADSILTTSNKIVAKKRMKASNLPTPPWVGPYPGRRNGICKGRGYDKASQATWIVKSVWEHASIGLDETSLVQGASESELWRFMARRATELGGACFGECFVQGREFNLSLLGGPHGPEVLPPAEIIFRDYGTETPRIVGYRAKWDDRSYEFHNTPRRFDFGPEDDLLLRTLRALSLACWKVFSLAGYARVDFRVDKDGRPWILEVNTNPCLSPDAGFAAAISRAGLSFPEAATRILKEALQYSNPNDNL